MKRLNLYKISISMLIIFFLACIIMDMYFLHSFRPFKYKWMMIGIVLIWIGGKND